ncbi:hypothetical protein I4U23_022886 [Adineta vaga]|nr:hypothetical protein I4U23_022886 [Adineta vaga]
MKEICLLGLAGLVISATIVLALIPTYLPNIAEYIINIEYSDGQSIVYSLPETIQLTDGSLTETQLKNFETAMQENLAANDKTRGSIILVKNGTAYTTSSKRKRRAQVVSVSEESQSTLSTTKRCKLSYVIKFQRKDFMKVRRMQLLQYIKQTVFTNLQVSGFDSLHNCTPNMLVDKLSLADVTLTYSNDEYIFNQANKPISLQFSCPILDTSNYILFSSNTMTSIINTTSTSSNITIHNGFPSGQTIVRLIALDIYGLPLFYSFSLYFGDISMPIKVLYKNGTVATNVSVQMNITDFNRVSQSAVTDSNGTALFINVPPVTISIFAHTIDNQIGLAGFQPTSDELIVTLIPFDHNTTKRRRRETDEGTPFNVFTNYVKSLQTRSVSFMSKANVSKVYVDYQFITSEVPGGFFGTQYNDYFSVTMRSDKGNYRTITQSMNSLGLGAFDYASGATAINKLTMPVGSESESIQIDIAVSNVGDSILQSELKVHKYGSDGCNECEKNCDKCKSDPMCSSSCANPPLKSCDFYLSCMERKVPCGSNGYAYNYGNLYCTKFVQNINDFSTEGQNWIYNTMNCLQKSLVSPLQNCVKDCDVLRNSAYDSHPSCYINNGVCELPALDYVYIFTTVFKGLKDEAGFMQAIITVDECLPKMIERISSAEILIPFPKTRIALKIIRIWLQSLSKK